MSSRIFKRQLPYPLLPKQNELAQKRKRKGMDRSSDDDGEAGKEVEVDGFSYFIPRKQRGDVGRT